MENLDIYKRSMQHKREAYNMVLRVASELEMLTSITDWLDWLRERNARSVSGNWVTVLVDGVGVDLHVATMTLMCNKGGGDNATARYMLDYTQHENASRAAEQYSRA